GALSRDSRDAARATGASLHRGGPSGAGHSLLAAGGPACHRALGQSRSRASSHPGAGGAPDVAGDPRAPPAREQRAERSRPGFTRRQGFRSPGDGQGLRPSLSALSAGGGDAAVVPGVARALAVLLHTGGVSDGVGAGGTASHSGPAPPRTRSPAPGPPRA